MHAWFLGTNPDKRVILASYEADFAASWGRKARSLLEDYGHWFNVAVSKQSSAMQRWDLVGHDGGMTTAGVGGPITGKGAHLLIIDDPIKNDEQARSPLQRQKQWDWWMSTASTRLRPGGLTVLIQTRWHRDDLTGQILRQAETQGQRWRQVVFPALAEQHDVLGRIPGEALWPEVFSTELMNRRKAGCTPYYWQSMYQQRPIPEGTAEWPDEYFGPDIWFDEWPQQAWVKVMALDPSKGTDAKFGDYAAFVMLQITPEGDLFVDAELLHAPTSLLAELALDMVRRFQPDGFMVETNQFQQLLADDMLRIADERRMHLPMYTVDNQVPKVVRIRRLTPYLNQKRLRFKARSPGARLLVEQMREFPCGDHDDGPDALEMAIRLGSQLVNEPYEPRLTRVYA